MLQKLKELLGLGPEEIVKAYIHAIKSDINRLDSPQWDPIRRQVRDLATTRSWNWARRQEEILRKDKLHAEIAAKLMKGDDISETNSQKTASPTAAQQATALLKLAEGLRNQSVSRPDKSINPFGSNPFGPEGWSIEKTQIEKYFTRGE